MKAGRCRYVWWGRVIRHPGQLRVFAFRVGGSAAHRKTQPAAVSSLCGLNLRPEMEAAMHVQDPKISLLADLSLGVLL